MTSLAAFALLAAGLSAQVPPVTEIALELSGKPVTLAPAKAEATVVIFVSARCPISNAYHERMNALYQTYAARNVQFAFVNANVNESVEEIENHARDNQLLFKIYRDPRNALADRLKAEFTPEVFVFSRPGHLAYHGSIDDARNEARVQVRGLRSALDALLAGRPVDPRETRAFGCTIKRSRKSS